jgi:hypothetical protein
MKLLGFSAASSLFILSDCAGCNCDNVLIKIHPFFMVVSTPLLASPPPLVTALFSMWSTLASDFSSAAYYVLFRVYIDVLTKFHCVIV